MINSDNIKNELTKIFKDFESLNEIHNEINLNLVSPKNIDIPNITNLFKEIEIFHNDLLYEIECNQNKSYNQKNINEKFENIEKIFLNYNLLKKEISNFEIQLLDKKTDYEGLLFIVENHNDEIVSINKKIEDNSVELSKALLELEDHKKNYFNNISDSEEDIEERDLNNSLNLEEYEDHPLHKIYIDFLDFSEQNSFFERYLKNALKCEKIKLEKSQREILKFKESFMEYKRDFVSKLNSVKTLLKYIEKDVDSLLEEAIVTNKNKNKNKKNI